MNFKQLNKKPNLNSKVSPSYDVTYIREIITILHALRNTVILHNLFLYDVENLFQIHKDLPKFRTNIHFLASTLLEYTIQISNSLLIAYNHPNY